MGSAEVKKDGNYRGYEDSSLLNRGEDLVNKSLMLVHGTADTDVHYGHMLRLSKELTDKNVMFRYVIQY